MRQKNKKTLKKKAWQVFSEYIRRKYADAQGMVRCVTCGAIKFWKEMQAGHLLDGRSNSVLFDEEIVFPQCPGCNLFKNGNKEVYIPWWIDRFGRAKYDEKIAQKKKTIKYTEEDYQQIIETYKEKTAKLE
jgi:hypothetical protein